jgi:hypothetical protein
MYEGTTDIRHRNAILCTCSAHQPTPFPSRNSGSILAALDSSASRLLMSHGVAVDGKTLLNDTWVLDLAAGTAVPGSQVFVSLSLSVCLSLFPSFLSPFLLFKFLLPYPSYIFSFSFSCPCVETCSRFILF